MRYGVFSILLALLAGILLLAPRYGLSTKQPVTLVVDADGGLRAYVPRAAGYAPGPGTRIVVRQTPAGDLALRVDSTALEPAATLLYLAVPGDSDALGMTGGNSCLQGFVVTGREKMSELILKKVRR